MHKAGASLVTSAPSMTKEDLKIICTHLVGLDRPSANEDRCLISHRYIVMGHITEPRNFMISDYKFSSRAPLMLKLTSAKRSTHHNILMTNKTSILICAWSIQPNKMSANDFQVLLCHWRS